MLRFLYKHPTIATEMTSNSRYYEYNTAESGRFPAGTTAYDPAGVYGSVTASNAGVSFTEVLTQNVPGSMPTLR